MLHSRLHGSTEPVPPRSILLVRKRPVEITCVVNEADHSLRFGVEVCTAPPNIPQTFLDSAKLYELSSAEDESKYEFEVTPEEWARTVAPLLRPASLLCDDALRLAVSNTPLTPEFLQTFEVIEWEWMRMLTKRAKTCHFQSGIADMLSCPLWLLQPKD